jgi:hypothetical protein
MYLGTQMLIVNINKSNVTGTGTPSALSPASFIAVAKPRNKYTPGFLGACRVFKWDGFSNGQIIRFDASYFMQSMAGPVMAPFVQNGLATSDTSLQGSGMMELASLYENPNSPFARVYTIRDYIEFTNNVLRTLTGGALRKWLPRNQPERDDDDEDSGMDS